MGTLAAGGGAVSGAAPAAGDQVRSAAASTRIAGDMRRRMADQANRSGPAASVGGANRPESARAGGCGVPPWGRGPRTEFPRRPPHRRHPRVGDARRRRQGQGAEGRGRERHRLRRGRARLPDARRTSSRPRSRPCRDPRFHHYSPTPGLPELREAIAHKTKRDSGVDCTAAQVARHQRRQARGVQHVPGAAATRATRCSLPAPYWTSYPECITLGGGVPVVLPTTGGDRLPRHGRPTRRRAARRARRRCCSCRRATRPARCTRPTEVEAIGRWARRARHLGRHRRDLRAPHLRRPRVRVDARRSCPSSWTSASSSTASPRRTR